MRGERWCALHGLAAGHWAPSGWEWSAEASARCRFHQYTASEARAALAGLHVLFIGNSVQRRAMYALAQLLDGTNATRRASLPEGDQIFDSLKSYHGFQHLRLRADGATRSWTPLVASEYCGVVPELFETGTVEWRGSTGGAAAAREGEWLSDPKAGLDNWGFTLRLSNLSAAAHQLFRRRGGGWSWSRRESDRVRLALAHAGVSLGRHALDGARPAANEEEAAAKGGVVTLRAVPELCAHARCQAASFAQWLVQLEAALRRLGVGEVRTKVSCIAGCRAGPMECAPGLHDPRVPDDEIGLSFLFDSSGLGRSVADVIRSWGTSPGLVGASADVVVLAPAKPGFAWVEQILLAIRSRAAAYARGRAAAKGTSRGASAVGDVQQEALAGSGKAEQSVPSSTRRHPPMWVFREFTHVNPNAMDGYGNRYDSELAAVVMRRLTSAGVLTVPAYRPTADGVKTGALRHESTRGIHFTDTGRTLIAQLVLNAVALRLASRQTSSTTQRRKARRDGTSHSHRRPIGGSQKNWPPGMERVGYCAVTDADEGDCRNGDKGNWGLRRHRIDDLSGCAARCQACPRCRFVSFSLAHEECGWFNSCPLPLELSFQGNTYITVKISRNRTKY